MQFKQVYIENELRWVYIFTKREAEVFRQATRNKKAPLDERIIRFVEHRRLVWATDGHQLACLTAKDDSTSPEPDPQEWAVSADDFKKVVAKSKVTQLVVLDCKTGDVGTLEKVDVENGQTLAPENIGTVVRLEEGFDLTEEHLNGILETIPSDENAKSGIGSFRMTTRFGHALSALAKATGENVAMVFVNAANTGGGTRWVAMDDMDGSRWDLIGMPIA